MPAGRAEVIVVGSGLTAWVAALELTRRGRRVVVASSDEDASETSPLSGHATLGPVPYPVLARRLGTDAARVVWEAGRDSAQAVVALAEELGAGGACSKAGGFVLACDRAEAASLAEAEDELREAGFAGEFLDHYMLESRFDLTGFTGGYWVADEVEYDGPRLTERARGTALDAGAATVTLRALDVDGTGARARTSDGEWWADWALLACEPADRTASIVEPLLPHATAHHAALAALGEGALRGRALPSPVRAFDGDHGWQGLSAGSPAPPLAWSGTRTVEPGLGEWLSAAGIPASRHRGRLRALSTADGLPAIGRLSASLFVAWGGQGSWSFAPVLVAQLAVRQALGTAFVPEAFRASRAWPG